MPGIDVTIDELLNQLSSPDFFEREEAVKRLSRIDADESVAGLVMALEDEDRGIRELASNSLVQQGGDTCSRLLASFMGHQDISVRNLAAEVLVRIGVDALPALIEGLESPDHDIRKFSLDVLGLIKDSSVAGRVHAMLDDSNQNVACSAAETLRYIGTPDSVQPLLEAFRKHEFLRPQAAEALGLIGSPKAYEGLREYLTSGDPVVLYSVIEAIGRLGVPEAVDELMPFIDGGMEMIADAATAAIIRLGKFTNSAGLSKFPDKRLRQFLLDSLSSDDRAIVQFALQELRHWNEPEIVGELINLIIKSDGDLTDQVCDILKTVGAPAVDAMREALHNTPDEGKIRLLDAICSAADSRMAEEVAKLASSPNPDIRQSVASALGRCGDKNSNAILRELVKDSVGHVRSAAVKAIGWLGATEEDVDVLIACLDDDYPDVREAAMGAMILVGDARVIKTFTEDLGHEDPERPRLAAIALGMIGEEETREPLISALTHSDPSVRRSAIEALVRLGGLDDIGPIRAGLSDENNLVRKAAVTAMVSFLGSGAITDIRHLLSDDDLWVQYHTIDIIGSLGNPSFLSYIIPFLSDDQDILKIAAIKALAAMGDRTCLEHLQHVASDGNKDLETAVEEAKRTLMETGSNG